ncbi:MAG TPA: peptidylprolyl isomerase, partial [Planctomycetota bacterium]|nr:peptidylprolyl isomerase [Planctomycetota bacterium]
PGERVGVAALESLARGDDAAIAKVGDVELRRSDAFRILDLAAPARSAEVIRQMVLTTGAQLDAAREGIDVPSALLERDIDAAISEQKASFALEVDEHLPLEDYLRQRHGLSPEAYHKEVRRMVLASMLLERAVRLDELRADHDELELIVVEDESLARDLAAQLEGGASFAVLAKKHSVHPSAAQGGSLPPVPSGSDIPLLDGRKDLQPGQRLGPLSIQVKGKTLWRLMRLVDRVPATAEPWAKLREPIERSLADRPLTPDELALFEAHIVDRYGVTRFTRPP